MRMFLRGFLGGLVVLFISLGASALDLFDLQSQSTQSLSLSGANTAIADDMSAFSLNPAGLSRHAESRFVGFENRYIKKGRNWSFAGGLIDGKTEDPLHWGFHINTVHTNDVEEDQYSLATSFNYENLVLVGLNHRFTKFHEATFTHDGMYYSLGLGVLAFVTDYISIGVSSQNAMRSEKYGSILPARVSAGIGGNFKFVRTDFDLERNLSQKVWSAKVGLEFRPSDTLILRAGWNQNMTHEDKGYSLGSSVSMLEHANLDFGFLDQLNSSIITFSGGFGLKI